MVISRGLPVVRIKRWSTEVPSQASPRFYFLSFSEYRKSARPFGHVDRWLWGVFLDPPSPDHHLYLGLEVRPGLLSVVYLNFLSSLEKVCRGC